jgi:ribosome maturation factor RimP
MSSNHPPSSQHALDRDALMRVLEPVVHAHGAEVVDIDFRPERGGWTLRVYVEKAGASEQALSSRDAAVNLELCANVSRDLSPALDVVDLIPHAYQLEVSSPGVERPLHRERDFVRFQGQKARIKRRTEGSSVPGQPAAERVVVGTLGGVTDGRVIVSVNTSGGKRTHEIPLSSIESARLVFEFGPAPRAPHAKGGGAGGHSKAKRTSSEKEPQQRKH